MLPESAALTFLPFAAAIGVWVSWSDLKFMRIPNKAVLTLLAVWIVAGLIVLPWQIWVWGCGLGLAVLVAGFIANSVGLIGAGDAKFAAAMAPFFILSDIRFVLGLYCACRLGAFASHRLLRRIAPFRAATEDWASWVHKDFPMGLALSGTLIFYLLAEILAFS